jgi:hypothetical protein
MSRAFQLSATLTVTLLLSACGSSKDTYRVRSLAWAADSVELHVVETAKPDASSYSISGITALCRSCNLLAGEHELTFNDRGVARVFMPEARFEVAPRISLRGGGIDTTVILHAISPADVAAYFHLSAPLIGRVLVLQESPLYHTATQDSVITAARSGDEMNIFAEDTLYFQVHHPLFPTPLFLLRTNAVRLF